MLQALYEKSPVWLQNCMAAVKGYQLYRTRYAGVYSKCLDEILEHEKQSAEWNRQLQVARLRQLIAHAGDTVPYYRDLFTRIGLRPEDIESVESLRALPLLDKETVRNNPEAFLSEAFSKRDYFSIYTSGTSGKMMTIFSNAAARQRNYAFYARFLTQAGCRRSPRKKATFSANIIVPVKQQKPPYWRHDPAHNNVLFSTFHMSDDKLGHYIHKLRQIGPEIIESYPSSLYVLARYMDAHGVSDLHPRLLVTSSEKLHDEWRQLIEQVFGCRIFDQYGCAEMCVAAGQCPEGNYHQYSDYGVMEIVNDGKVVGPDTLGEIVCTGFINDVMPLIRYRIGDVGAISSGECACGSPFPVMVPPEGRMDEFIVTRDKRYIGRTGTLFSGYPVQAFLIVQEEYDYLKVTIEKGEGYEAHHTEAIIQDLRRRTSPEMKIDVLFDTDIVGRAGKFRKVVSHVLQRDGLVPSMNGNEAGNPGGTDQLPS